MAIPTSRSEFSAYCLRKLGAPAIQINVATAQIEDRIDDALAYYQTYHFDGSEKVYLKHQLTATTITLDSAIVANPAKIITTPEASAEVYDSSGTTLRVWKSVGTIEVGDTITFDTGDTRTVEEIVIGDFENKYLTLANNILNVVRVIRAGNYTTGMFDIRYQMALNALPDISSIDLTSYVILKQHLSLINQILVGETAINYSRVQNKATFNVVWEEEFRPDEYVVIEAYATLDPASYTKIFGDIWLREYATQLIKKQWGQNMSKYKDIALLGGITLNGQTMIAEADIEIEKLEKRLKSEFQEPVGFFMG